jgi:hypothetical protein
MASRKIGEVIYADGTKAKIVITKSGKVLFKPTNKSLWSILKQLLTWDKES